MQQLQCDPTQKLLQMQGVSVGWHSFKDFNVVAFSLRTCLLGMFILLVLCNYSSGLELRSLTLEECIVITVGIKD